MKPVLAAVVLLGACSAASVCARGSDAKPFEVPGYFRVGTPGDGWSWKAIKTVEVGGTRTRVFACAKAGSKSRVVITMQEKTADTDARRSTAAKAHYAGMLETLKKGGFTAITGGPPALSKKPIADSVPFAITAKGPDGKDYTLKSASIFKKHTYLFQVTSNLPEETARLFKLARNDRRNPPQARVVKEADAVGDTAATKAAVQNATRCGTTESVARLDRQFGGVNIQPFG